MRRGRIQGKRAAAGAWALTVVALAAVTTRGRADDPVVGHAQRVRIAEEIVGSSSAAWLHAPVSSTGRVMGREAERIGVRWQRTWLGAFPHLADRGPEGCDDRDLGGGFGGPALPARLVLLPSSESAFQAFLRQVESAERRIDLMMYGWQDDPTGREAAEALAARARQGVRVRVLVDRTSVLIHNEAAARGCRTFLDDLRTVPNVTVIEPPGTYFQFDHRKLALIDGRRAWSGGMILTESARRHWQNVAFLAEGPVVGAYAGMFEERWREVGGAPEPSPPVDQVASAGAPNAEVRLVRTDVGERSFRDAIYHAVDHARWRIEVLSAYFTDDILAAKLVAARARGVDVRVVLSLEGNVRDVNHYHVLTANHLWRGGVRVFLYPGMTHVKSMMVDGVWAYLGSGNFDELSLRNNREAGLAITSPEVVAAFDRLVFEPDVASAQELCGPLPCPRDWPVLKLFSLWY